MFGYVVINEPELKIKDYREYRGVYCGLCQTLKRKYGPFGQLCLNNDMTFMALLHMSLYEDEKVGRERMYRCKLHPTRKQKIYENPCLEYAADMTLVLSYYLARGHWMDDPEAGGSAAYASAPEKGAEAFKNLSKAVPGGTELCLPVGGGRACRRKGSGRAGRADRNHAR